MQNTIKRCGRLPSGFLYCGHLISLIGTFPKFADAWARDKASVVRSELLETNETKPPLAVTIIVTSLTCKLGATAQQNLLEGRDSRSDISTPRLISAFTTRLFPVQQWDVTLRCDVFPIVSSREPLIARCNRDSRDISTLALSQFDWVFWIGEYI